MVYEMLILKQSIITIMQTPQVPAQKPTGVLQQSTLDKKTFVCVHCKRQFSSYKGLTAHLAGCTERKLKRVFDVGKYKFVLTMNPLHRVVRGLREVQRQIKGKYPDEEKLFTAVLMYLQATGQVDSYEILAS